jgi:hypothetical protein
MEKWISDAIVRVSHYLASVPDHRGRDRLSWEHLKVFPIECEGTVVAADQCDGSSAGP